MLWKLAPLIRDICKVVFFKVLKNIGSLGSSKLQKQSFVKKRSQKFRTIHRKTLWHRCFPVSFAKILRTPFIIEHLWWLLLKLRLNDHYLTFPNQPLIDFAIEVHGNCFHEKVLTKSCSQIFLNLQKEVMQREPIITLVFLPKYKLKIHGFEILCRGLNILFYLKHAVEFS